MLTMKFLFVSIFSSYFHFFCKVQKCTNTHRPVWMYIYYSSDFDLCKIQVMEWTSCVRQGAFALALQLQCFWYYNSKQHFNLFLNRIQTYVCLRPTEA
jgi:hypothetical protein